eukprot:CAMPEP_0202768066 /NCGR_PEP_ID=MMETSP1388-20130828/34000_1 /ASSEMBLY_ACC=CAM_ASM_000864 /TAXON_ID=37098 /ORGANISM="Isochrysis sp, Strain CCMP1244" /LENGTH=144 /DNA_ID=CAMNT_0049436785 /DNA_START=244 /DNA_END=679 /DNA_ORIENTATION=-
MPEAVWLRLVAAVGAAALRWPRTAVPPLEGGGVACLHRTTLNRARSPSSAQSVLPVHPNVPLRFDAESRLSPPGSRARGPTLCAASQQSRGRNLSPTGKSTRERWPAVRLGEGNCAAKSQRRVGVVDAGKLKIRVAVARGLLAR